MPSGNFLVGEDFSLQQFAEYVLPILEEGGLQVPDRVSFTHKRAYNKSILISLSGEGDLEGTLNNVLVEVGEEFDKLRRQRKDGFWEHQVRDIDRWEGEGENQVTIHKGKYEVVGLYEDNETASKLFPALAYDFLLKGAGLRADDVKDKIKGILGKKLSDL